MPQLLRCWCSHQLVKKTSASGFTLWKYWSALLVNNSVLWEWNTSCRMIVALALHIVGTKLIFEAGVSRTHTVPVKQTSVSQGGFLRILPMTELRSGIWGAQRKTSVSCQVPTHLCPDSVTSRELLLPSSDSQRLLYPSARCQAHACGIFHTRRMNGSIYRMIGELPPASLGSRIRIRKWVFFCQVQ